MSSGRFSTVPLDSLFGGVDPSGGAPHCLRQSFWAVSGGVWATGATGKDEGGTRLDGVTVRPAVRVFESSEGGSSGVDAVLLAGTSPSGAVENGRAAGCWATLLG